MGYLLETTISNYLICVRITHTLGEQVGTLLIYGSEHQCSQTIAIRFNAIHLGKLIVKFTKIVSVTNVKHQWKVLNVAAPFGKKSNIDVAFVIFLCYI